MDQDIGAFSEAWVPAVSITGGGFREGQAAGFDDGLAQIISPAHSLAKSAEVRLKGRNGEVRKSVVD